MNLAAWAEGSGVVRVTGYRWFALDCWRYLLGGWGG